MMAVVAVIPAPRLPLLFGLCEMASEADSDSRFFGSINTSLRVPRELLGIRGGATVSVLLFFTSGSCWGLKGFDTMHVRRCKRASPRESNAGFRSDQSNKNKLVILRKRSFTDTERLFVCGTSADRKDYKRSQLPLRGSCLPFQLLGKRSGIEISDLNAGSRPFFWSLV